VTADIDPREGQRIGSYTLVRPLGEGGFGTVYLAEQKQPVRRMVALKVVKLGMDTKAVIARFERERQALATMEHPHIARVLGAGATENGRPYFVMEYVEGVPITEFCEGRSLSTRDRLALFGQVCHAIQHAHQKGTIHRDIKPSNVLVGEMDGRPVPKVIDFGIAKAADASGDATVTGAGFLVGTPAFMSPEQLEGGDVDTRSDVYSLGALLHELLCGRPPFDFSGLNLSELIRQVREQDPAHPSDVAARAGRRGVPRELDWIVLRCLEKQPARRYESANALAEDVERFLEDRPTAAAPPSIAYRIAKWVRRHRAASLAAAVVLLSCAAGATGTVLAFFEAQREAVHAREAEARAELEAEEAQRQARIAGAVRDFLNDDLLGAVAPSAAPGRGREVRMREVLDVAAERVRRASEPGGRFHGEPLVEAAIRQTIGNTYRTLGVLDQAREHLERAAVLRGEQLGAQDLQSLETRTDLARVLLAQGDVFGAEAEFRALLAAWQSLLGPSDERTLDVQRWLGITLHRAGRFAESLEVLEKAHEVAVESYGEQSETARLISTSMARDVYEAGRETEAIETLRRDLESDREVRGYNDPSTLANQLNLATMLRSVDRHEEAEPLYLEALELLLEVVGREHPTTLVAYQGVTELYREQGRLEEASVYLDEGLEAARSLLGGRHPTTLGLMASLARITEANGELDAAEELYRELYDVSRDALGARHPLALARASDLGGFLVRREEFEEAERLLLEALEGKVAVFGEDHPQTVGSRGNLGMLYAVTGRGAEAEAHLRKAYEGGRRLLDEGSGERAALACELGAVIAESGRPKEAEALVEAAVKVLQPRHGGDFERLIRSTTRLADSWEAEGDGARAAHWREVARELESARTGL